MTIGQVMEQIIKYHTEALKRDYIRKPLSWALYQTWKDVDAREKERNRNGNDKL